MARLTALLGFVCLAAFCTEVRAQATETGGGQTVNGYSPEEEHAHQINDALNPIENFEGWSQLYKSYDKSPIAFDSMRTGKRRKYPQLSYFSDENLSQRNQEFGRKNTGRDEYVDEARSSSIKRLNLGVDDEVLKTSMAVYQPIFKVANDFAGDQFERDNHLNLMKSIRGIAIMTLSYLDKTVAASLATTQAQVDERVSQHLLKQIAWANEKLANPSKSQVFTDTDEKVEACMASGGDPSLLFRYINMPRLGADECRQCVRSAGGTATIPSEGAGLFSYCVCCSEVLARINYSTVGKESGPRWSIAERLFYGTDRGERLPRAAYVNAVYDQFRFLYGDVTYEACKPGEDSRNCLENKFEFKLPEYSVADKVLLFRNGLNTPGCSGGIGSACPITGVQLKQGICPSIQAILCKWPEFAQDYKRKADYKDLWVQASLGTLLTAADFEQMIRMIGTAEFTEMKNSCSVDESTMTVSWGAWKPRGRFRLWLDRFCDASAMSAFKKYHVRMNAVVEDHLRLNRKISEHDRYMVRDLVGRVTSDIQLVEMDRGATAAPDAVLAGLNLEGSRRAQNELGTTKESLDADRLNASNSNSVTLSSGYRDRPLRESVTSTFIPGGVVP